MFKSCQNLLGRSADCECIIFKGINSTKKWHLIKLHCVLLLLSGLSPTTHTRYSNSLKVFLKVAWRGRKDPALERTAEKGRWVELEIGYLRK